MVKVLRSVLAIFAGLFVGFLAVLGGEMIGHHAYPPPSGMDIHNAESLSEAMKAMPGGAFVAVLLSWAVGTFAGAWVTARIAAVGKLWHGLVIGGTFLAAGLANMLMIPHPGWVMVVGLGECFPIAYLGAKLATKTIAKTGPIDVDM